MFEAVFSLLLTAFLLLGSPGPAPLALAATGAVFGVRRGVPFLLGILLGLAVAIMGAALGLGALFAVYPQAAAVMQVIGAVYVLFIAYKIATAPVLAGATEGGDHAPTFFQGFVLNLMNPKAYAAFFALFSQFLLPMNNHVMAFLFTGLLCFGVAVVVDVVWLCLGGVMRPLFTRPKQARLLRLVFALLMLFAVGWALKQLF